MKNIDIITHFHKLNKKDDKKLNKKINALNADKSLKIERIIDIWTVFPVDIYYGILSKQTRQLEKIHELILAILLDFKNKKTKNQTLCNGTLLVQQEHFEKLKNLSFNRIIETKIVQKLSTLDLIQKTRSNTQSGSCVYSINLLKLIYFLSSQTSKKKSKVLCSPCSPYSEQYLNQKYTYNYLKNHNHLYTKSSTRLKELYKKFNKKRKTIPGLFVIENKKDDSVKPRKEDIDEIKNLLDWAMTLKCLPSHKTTTKTYKRCLYWLRQLHKGTFIKTKSKLIDFMQIQELPRKHLEKPKSVKELRIALKRLHLLRKNNKKIAVYSLSDLIYNSYHPNGYLSPILTVMVDKNWDAMYSRSKPILVSSVIPKTERRFADLFRINPQIQKYEYKRLQDTLSKIISFRCWLPKTGGQLDRQFPINKPGRFLKSFYDYIVLDRQYKPQSVWDIDIQKKLFRQFLDEYYIADAAGYVKDTSLYLDDYLHAQIDIPHGEVRVQFKKDVQGSSSVNGYAYRIDQIVCLPAEKAEFFIAKNIAVLYKQFKPRCKTFAAKLNIKDYL